MSIGLVLKESMSGWVSFDEGDQRQDVSFSICAFTSEIFKFGAPRNIIGSIEFGEKIKVSVTGTLTLRMNGPKYCLYLTHPDYGKLEIKGSKTYSLSNLKKSLITCPLTVYKNEEKIGCAEVVYKEPMWRFVFDALQLVSEEQAYLPFEVSNK